MSRANLQWESTIDIADELAKYHEGEWTAQQTADAIAAKTRANKFFYEEIPEDATDTQVIVADELQTVVSDLELCDDWDDLEYQLHALCDAGDYDKSIWVITDPAWR